MVGLIQPHKSNEALLWQAVAISLCLHVLAVLLYPALSRIKLPETPERMEITLFTAQTPAPAPAQVSPAEASKPTEMPKPEPKVVKPVTPVETPKPVLAASNTQDADYRVQTQATAKLEPTPTTPAPSNTVEPSPAVTASSQENTAKEAKPATAAASSVTTESDALNASDTDAWGDYGEQLRALVNKSKQYPAIAVRRHLEGEATVTAQFIKGELVSVSLADSSTHAPLDEEAMRMVKKAIAQLGLRDSLKHKTFKITIPVAFKLV